MEVSNTIMQLCAYREMFLNEIAQIDTDVQNLGIVSERYPPADISVPPLESRKHRKAPVVLPKRAAAAFSKPAAQLRALRAEKEKGLNDVQRQLELFQLHNTSGQKLLRKLGRLHGGTITQGGGDGVAVPVVTDPYVVTLTSDIAAS